MSRRHAAQKRQIIPDVKYNDIVVAKFMNYLMLSGKKSVAERIVYDTLDSLSEKAKADPVATFKEAVNNVKPTIEVRSRRVGGATYQVPTEVRPERGLALALRWIINSARLRKEKTMFQRLAAELMDAHANRGSAVKKREDTHKMAEANRAFAHFRW